MFFLPPSVLHRSLRCLDNLFKSLRIKSLEKIKDVLQEYVMEDDFYAQPKCTLGNSSFILVGETELKQPRSRKKELQ